jgi:hypothetical protein
VIGNCPWWDAHQHERLSGFIRRIKIFKTVLGDEDAMMEAKSDALVRATPADLFWAKIDPSSPDDLACDFGTLDGSAVRTARWKDGLKAEVVGDAVVSSGDHVALRDPGSVPAPAEHRVTRDSI